jgi:hypothetical protein
MKMDLRKKQNVDLIESESRSEVKHQLKADDWLCIACNKKITEDKERFFYNNSSEFRFTNPNGYIFDIITFKTAEGCCDEGESTLDFTWFSGHSWCFALCTRCKLHLGWKYSGKFSFYGLIKARLVKGSVLFN